MTKLTIVDSENNRITAVAKHRIGRNRRPLPPLAAREWLTPNEAAQQLGCSVVTVHQLRRGLIPDTEPLPFSQYGRKVVFRKESLARWQERNEQNRAA